MTINDLKQRYLPVGVLSKCRKKVNNKTLNNH